jgi:hypothetical protein
MTRIIIAALATLALTAPTALAQEPLTQGYAPPGGTDQAIVGGAELTDDGGTPEVAGAQESGGGDPSAAQPAGEPAGTESAGDAGDAPVAQAETASASSLPFTGLNTSTIVLSGVLLLLVGLAMRRLVQAPATLR